MVMIASFLLLASAKAVLPANLSAPKIEDMTVTLAETPHEDINQNLHCNADKNWCFKLSKDDDLNVVNLTVWNGKRQTTFPLDYEERKGGFDHSAVHIWLKLIETEDAVFLGVIDKQSTMYSGGWASAETLALYRFTEALVTQPHISMAPVLFVPFSGNVAIRACFSEKDYKLRRKVCHDTYDFRGDLTLGSKSSRTGYPELVFKSKATTQPRLSRRSKDNTSGQKPLSKADIKEAIDPECSYTRTARFDEKTGQYAFDKPLPDCSDYTVP
jgi:hypothetical protein